MSKLTTLRSHFGDLGIDAMLITSEFNRRFITGFTGSTGNAIVTKDGAVFLTDFRYTQQAKSQVKDFTIHEFKKSLVEETAEKLKELGATKIGFEKEHMSYGLYELYNKAVDGVLVPFSSTIENMRMIKTEDELSVLRKAAEIADQAFEHICTFIKPGMKEIDVSNELEFFMRKLGATSSSFDIIVASGERSALPHGVASEKVIEKGDFVTLDFGAYFNGYVSDITRTVAVGEPSEKLKEIYQIVLDAQEKSLREIKPGMNTAEADAIARDHIKSHGYGDAFGHSLGHGIGLEVHEGPGLSPRSSVILEPGMVITIEPGIYLEGIGGVRIEDDAIVTENGLERLTHSTKELRIL
ncbi:M24 family metallopeptidase [Paenisporosarcina cavernae]|uniref:Aminopeptidase P family protein n=1 Tax=Paenisporosarcina cavernae TaxID=2320858 RepID=A0A385YTA8_9BACL|nr:Xaa-Pro peptidase family protein [Paenisporosarcina cavernae]AYC29550.1 aminopeptidase P family protein [Paenisporosarcina cavernae]